MKITRPAAFAAAIALGAVALTGCSSTTSTPDVTVSSPDMVEADRVGDPSTWTPEVVTPSDTPIPLIQGQYVSLDGMPELPDNYVILADTSDRDIISLNSIGPDDYAMVYAKGIGDATVDIYFEDASNTMIETEPVATFAFTVRAYNPSEASPDWVFNDSPDMGSDPASWTPVVITATMEEVELTEGQFAFIDPAPVAYDNSVELVSSNPSIIDITEIGGDTDTIRAANVGDTVLTVIDTDGVGEFMKVKISVIPNPNMP